MGKLRKIINDPVYGFITVDHPLVLQLISHPYYQRLRNIHQMAFAHLVYPGAMHSRLHHSLGAYHLMCTALSELKAKGVEILPGEELGARIAILLHDIGHGPYSHALEKQLVKNVHHETISLLILEELNKEFGGKLDTAISIFKGDYHKNFLHQLVSGQLDVDRLDYLNRDSFFTGVAEGVIGYDRILKMLTVHEGELMVEEKAIYSIEKFLVSRRLMYWQVYLHKAVLSVEKLLVKILERAREIRKQGIAAIASTPSLEFFLEEENSREITTSIEKFCRIDDNDVMVTIKNWIDHPDKILSLLCRSLVERKLLKVKLQPEPFGQTEVESLKRKVMQKHGFTEEETGYFVFTGEAQSTTYDPVDEKINILFKDGTVKDISQVDNALIHPLLVPAVKKHYICYLTH